jgi:aldose 1-epimerase
MTPCAAPPGKQLGVEPMTAEPDAFRTGDGLITLGPGHSHRATWGLRTGAR